MSNNYCVGTNYVGRTGTIFPAMGSYTNTGSSVSRQVTVQAIRTSGDDTLTVFGDIGTWLKITEISA